MLDEETRAALRLRVTAFRAATPRRIFPPALHIGALPLGTLHVHCELDPDLMIADPGLRTDLAAQMVHDATALTPRPAAWLTRVGAPEPHDLDVAWLPAVRRAFAELDVEPTCIVVVTKLGWYDPVHDDGARWERPRIRAREQARLARGPQPRISPVRGR